MTGGLTDPLTFVRDQPTKPATCWYNVVIHQRKWTTFDGYKIHCR